MASTQTGETIPRNELTYDAQVERAREKLLNLGYNVLAVMGPEDSSGRILAGEIGSADIQQHVGLPDVLEASSVHTGERKVAGILPYYIAGEGHVTLTEEDDTRVLDAIGTRSRQHIARVDMPYGETYIAMAIIDKAA
jgi:hypothetical protein